MPSASSRPRQQPSREVLGAMLKRAARIQLSPPQLEQLWGYHNLLRERNHDRDLTRIVGFENMVIKHYIDSMMVGDLFRLPSPLLDVGTGAGFPGIPLKIRYPGLALVLAEPRPRRVSFLNDAVRALRLKNVEVFPHRVVSRSFRQPVAGVITRALEPMVKTVLRTSACTPIGCQLVFMKGPAVDPEIQELRRAFAGELKLVKNQAYLLPGIKHERRLVVFERTALPRNLAHHEDQVDGDEGDAEGDADEAGGAARS
jgi:16S rRNA (guanine(527)-N(7))-methyltransferase RsmG